jgi:ATP-dependent helicase YprA (DUF1998 family)
MDGCSASSSTEWKIPRRSAPAVAGEQNIKRFGRGHHDVRGTAHHGLPDRRRGVPGAHQGADDDIGIAARQLKSGELRALVATASLELGIDIGDIDLVCQLGSTRSIAQFLQRVGRSGHAVR